MGLFDFLGGGKDPQKNIDRIKRRLMDQYRQTHERYEAMDDLAKLGTPAALEAMLERFTLRVSGPTVDEEEKDYCYQQIAKWGKEAEAPLRHFIATRDAVYFPLKALRELAGEDAAVEALLHAIQDCDPGYHEGLERLREIVSNLRDFQHDRVRDALVSLLTSRSNEIRFYALDGLSTYPGEQVAPYFAERMLDPEESMRVKSLAFELALEHELPLGQWADALQDVVPPNYVLGEDGKLQRS
ncbi:MAG: HEAT repeat domain-containing protein [Deltaproteobacteria bacterium]|nr:HEAT repeat domain-containing protein [Deltaproteobacteria bacterium]